jgi:hypothetical protein
LAATLEKRIEQLCNVEEVARVVARYLPDMSDDGRARRLGIPASDLAALRHFASIYRDQDVQAAMPVAQKMEPSDVR